MSNTSRPKLLDNAQFDASMAKLRDWEEVEGEDAIRKMFKFRNFDAAFDFMTRVAKHAQKLDHHPTWINEFNRVDIVLTTHDLKGISDLDVQLAHLIDEEAATTTK
jgi:4a-hydroxytetrahydrobiopterin dehydratase